MVLRRIRDEDTLRLIPVNELGTQQSSRKRSYAYDCTWPRPAIDDKAELQEFERRHISHKAT